MRIVRINVGGVRPHSLSHSGLMEEKSINGNSKSGIDGVVGKVQAQQGSKAMSLGTGGGSVGSAAFTGW